MFFREDDPTVAEMVKAYKELIESHTATLRDITKILSALTDRIDALEEELGDHARRISMSC